MNVNAQKFQSLYALVRKPLAWSNQRTTLPQSALAGCQLPQRGSRETPPSIRVLAKILRYGRFSSPLRNSDDFGFYHSSNDTPSVSPSGCQLPQRGSRETLPFIRLLAKIPGYGRFSSSLRNSEDFNGGPALLAVNSSLHPGRRRYSIPPGTGRAAAKFRRSARPSSPRCCAGSGGRRCLRSPAA